MSGFLKTAAAIAGSVALIATGIGAAAGAGLLASSTTILGASLSTIATIGAVAAGVSAVAGLAANLIRPGQSYAGSVVDVKIDAGAGIPYKMGRCFSGPNIVYRRTYGADHQYYGWVAISSGAGPIDGTEEFLFDKAPVTFSGANANGKYHDYLFMQFQLGDTPQATQLSMNEMPNWGSAYKLSGYSAYAPRFSFDKKGNKWPNSIPEFGTVDRGVKVYDPRRDDTYPGGSGPVRPCIEHTYVYDRLVARPPGANAWLHALTFALGRWQNPDFWGGFGRRVLGVGIPLALINVASFVEAANVADANGWSIGGVVYSTDDKWATLKLMAQAGGGHVVWTGGKLTAIVNAPKISLATITPADLAEGEIDIPGTQTRRDRINGIIPRYRSEAHGWGIVPQDVIRIPEYVTLDGGERTRELPYDLVTDIDQAAELAAYDIFNARELGPIVLPLKTKWISYLIGDCLTVDLPEHGLINQDVIVLGRTIDPRTGTVTLTLRTETSGKHAAALGKTGVAPPVPELTAYDPTVVAAPVAADWTVTGATLSDNGASIPALVINRAAEAAINPNVEAIIVEYRPHLAGNGPDDNWGGASIEPYSMLRREIGTVTPGTQYDVSLRYQILGIVGDRRIYGPVTAGSMELGWSDITDPDGTRPEDNATVGAPPGTNVGGVPAEILVASVNDVLTSVAEIEGDIAELFSAVGSGIDAAASAAAALASEVAAGAHAGNALISKQAAEAASATATTQAGVATTQRAAADAAAAVAIDNKNLAAGHASTATTQAGIATADAAVATAAAGVATSEKNLTASYRDVTIRAASVVLPSDFTQGALMWRNGYSGPHVDPTPFTFTTVDGFATAGATLPAGASRDIAHRGSTSNAAGRKWRLTIEAKKVGATAISLTGYGIELGPDGTATHTPLAISAPLTTSWATFVGEWTAQGSGPTIRGLARVAGEGQAYIRRILLEDITESAAAKAQADISTAQAVIATDKASQASVSQSLSAGFAATRGLTANGDFSAGAAQWTVGSNFSWIANTGASWGTLYSGVWRSTNGVYAVLYGPTIEVDRVGRKYQLNCQYGSVGASPTHYIGVELYDANMTHLGVNEYIAPSGQAHTAIFRNISQQLLLTQPTIKFIRPIFLANYPVPAPIAGARADVDYLFIEDVTERVAAASQTTIATNQAVVATNQAAAASTSAALSAQVKSRLANKGATFSSWNDGQSYPSTYWLAWGDQSTVSRQAGLVGRWGYRQSNLAGSAEKGLYTQVSIDDGLTGLKPGCYVMEGDVTLNSGSLQGAGMLLYAIDAGEAVVGQRAMSFTVDPSNVSNGAPNGVGVAGRRYRFSMFVDLTAATTMTYLRLYLMTSWNGFGTVSAKDLTWHECGVRPAVEGEIQARKALADVSNLSATVTTQAGAIANLETGKASASSVTALTARVGTAESNISTISTVAANAQGTANAIHGVLLDVNGRVSGTVSANNGATSSFKILTDVFEVSAPGGGARTTYANGAWKVFNAGGQVTVQLGNLDV